MLGQNILPDGYETVVDGLDENKVAQALDHLRRGIQETASRLPLHGEFVQQCCNAASAASRPPELAL